MKHVLYIVGVIIVAVAFWAVMMYGEIYWLSNRVVPVAGTRLPEWLDNFQKWAAGGIYGSLAAAVLWYVLGQWVFKFNTWGKNYRPIWALLLIVPIALAVLGCWDTKQAVEGATWAYLFYFANNILTYYVGTLLFSPSSVMYTPLLAEYARRW